MMSEIPETPWDDGPSADELADDLAEVLSFLGDARERQFRLYVTIDPERSGHGDQYRNDPAVEALKKNIEDWSGSIFGCLIAHGPKHPAWLERMVGGGSSATSYIARHRRKGGETA